MIARVEKRFKSPGPQPNGLQAADDGLWVIDQANLKVYKLDWETGETLFEAQTDTEHSSGITLGGGYLWIASTFELKIAKLSIETGETIEKYDSPGAGIISTREGVEGAQVTGSHGMEWKDGMLYIATPPSQMVHVIDVETWEEVDQFRTPGPCNHGLTRGRKWSPVGGRYVSRRRQLTGHQRWPGLRCVSGRSAGRGTRYDGP